METTGLKDGDSITIMVSKRRPDSENTDSDDSDFDHSNPFHFNPDHTISDHSSDDLANVCFPVLHESVHHFTTHL